MLLPDFAQAVEESGTEYSTVLIWLRRVVMLVKFVSVAFVARGSDQPPST